MNHHTIRIELQGTSDLEYHLPNEKDKFGLPIPHRKTVTGTDRRGTARLMSVVGLMPVVVHGFADGEPHSLVIFEWDIASERRGLRFKTVTIEAAFVADGPRGEAEYEAEELRQRGGTLDFWDPEIVAFEPSGTEWYNRTQRKIGGKNALDIGFSTGFSPFLTVEPKFRMERDTSTNITDAIQLIGRPFVTGAGRHRPNAIRWTMTENKSQRSGVPSYLRTAVLLKRQQDDNGLFLGHFKVETHISWWEDLMEKKRMLTGSIRPDEPIIFDPNIVESSQFDAVKNNLNQVDLNAEFKVIMLGQVGAAANETLKPPGETELEEEE